MRKKQQRKQRENSEPSGSPASCLSMHVTPITAKGLSRMRSILNRSARRAPITLMVEDVAELLAYIDSMSQPPEALQYYLKVKEFCKEFGGGRGIWKRIDENRELLQSLQEKAPDILERCPWIESFLYTQDAFLTGLAAALYLEPPFWASVVFPREWPGKWESPPSAIPTRLRIKLAPSRVDKTGNDRTP